MTHTNHVIKSAKLGKNVNVRVYGTKGYPIIAFPTQDQMADEWEANGMTDVFAPYVNDGRVQLFTVDSNDLESWSNPSEDYAARIARQEDYYDFVCDELLPFVHETNGSQLRPELTGASLGATQATICALRRPDLFQGVIALSGMYHTSYFFGNWGNALSYANDVNAFLPNTPADHPYIQLYRQRTFAFSIGQAADEQFGVSDLHFLQQTFERLGINGWFDFWGPECNHDWYWWKQQMGKFLPEAVSELEGVAASEPELCKPVAKKAVTAQKSVAKKAAPAQEPASKKASNKKTAAPATKHVDTKVTSKDEGRKEDVTTKVPAAKASTGAQAKQVQKNDEVATAANKAKVEHVAAKASRKEATADLKATTSKATKATSTASKTTAVAKPEVAKATATNNNAAKTMKVEPAKKQTATATAAKANATEGAPAKSATVASKATTSTTATKANATKASGSKTTSTHSKSTSHQSTTRRSSAKGKSTRARKAGKKSAK